MFTTLLLTGALLAGQAPPSDGNADAAAAEKNAADAALQVRVRRLLRLLDDDVRDTREKAEKDLIGIGPHALDFLPFSDTGLSAEVKERLGRVRKQLETEAAEAAVEPTTVTLEGQMSLAEAIAAITKQTGNRIEGTEGRDATVKLSLKDADFWPALDQVLDQVGLDINPYGGYGDRLSLFSRPETEVPRYGHAAYSGIFRIEPLRIEAVRNLRNPQVSGMKLLTRTCWEPRTRPILLTQKLDKLTAVDEQGNPVRVDGIEGELQADVQADIPAVDLYLPFQLPARGVKKIASLKGEMTAVVPGRVETFEFDGLAMSKDVEQRRAGVTVVFESARKNGDAYEVRIRVKFDDAANALESYQTWIYDNPAYLVDREGKKIDKAGYTPTSRGENEAGQTNEVGMALFFVPDKALDNYKLVYKTPAALIKQPISYELKDIPLP